MATQQLLDYIKQQQQKGIPQETIKNSLISAGWKISDIEEAFGSLESPKGVEPPISRGSVGVGFQAFLQTVFNQRLILLVYIIGFLLVATWVFGYFYYFQSPEKIVQKMTQKMVEVKSLEYFGQIETEIKASNFIPSLPLGGGGSLFQPQQPSPAKQTGKFLINFNGVSDLQDLNKPKSVFKFGIDTDTDILPQGFRFGLEVRTIDKLTYLKLDNVPDLGFLDLNFLKDQWIKIDLETIVKQFGLEKLEEQLKTIQQEQEQEQELSPEQIEQLRKTIAKIKIFKITEKLASERIDGVNTYHYKLLIDKEGFIQLLTEINKIVQNKLITEKELAELNKSLEAIALPEVEIWIGKKDLLLYKILFSHTIKETEQTKASGKFTIRVQFKNYNKPVQIEIPKSVKTLGEILGELLGPTGLQLTDETADWRLFNNSTISFKYPNDWNIEDEANVVTIFGPNQRMFPDLNDTTYKYFPFYVKIVRHANAQDFEEKDWAKKNILTYCSGEITKSPLSFEDFRIGEVSGIKITAVDIPPTLISKKGDQIWTLSINVGYCDGGSPVDENETKTKYHINIFNHILSTFKFLN